MTFTISKKQAQTWEKAKELDEFNAQSLTKFGINLDTARRYINRWEVIGTIRFVRRDDKNRRYFTPSDNLPGRQVPISGEATAEGNMWFAMRQLKTFSATDVAANSNIGEVLVTVDYAASYCRMLLNAGYLRIRDMEIKDVREQHYQIVKNTGPRAPQNVCLSGVLDPNEHKFTPADPRVST